MEVYAVKILDITNEQLNTLSLLIDTKKRNRIEKFIKKRDKLRALIGEILLRSVINQKFNIHHKDIMFCKNNYGKPYLKNYPTISFNLSHSGDFVVCVFDNHPVGIDIEKIKVIEYISLAKKFFTKKEYNYIMKGDFRQQLDKFYDIWTLKESFIKCCGKGLSLPLNSFSVEIYGCNDIKLVTDSSSAKYTLQILEIDPEYKMSMCTLHTDITSNIIILNQNELINKYCEIYTKNIYTNNGYWF